MFPNSKTKIICAPLAAKSNDTMLLKVEDIKFRHIQMDQDNTQKPVANKSSIRKMVAFRNVILTEIQEKF